MDKSKRDIHQIVAPIFAGEMLDEDFQPIALLGTAFSIGNGYFLTAGHVLDSAKQYKSIVLGFRRDFPDHLQFCPVRSSEYKVAPDVGLISANLIEVKPLLWNAEQLLSLTDVRSHGFPFGYDTKTKLTFNRSVKGYVVSALRSWEKYELSFHCPRGISGAPLISNDDHYQVTGLITGNASVDIEVYKETELLDDGQVRTTYFKTETTTFGIALQASEVLKQNFEMLNGTIENHLKSQNLLIGQ